MSSYEYKVVTAPSKGVRAPGVKGSEGRFAHALEEAMNQMAGEGWEYVRAETLPAEERAGLTSTQTVYHNVLVFRRLRSGDMSAFDPRVLEAPKPAPMLPPPSDEFMDDDPVSASDHWLSTLLKRRATRLFAGTASAPGPRKAPEANPDFDPTFAAKLGEDEEYEDPLPQDFYGSDTLDFADRGNGGLDQRHEFTPTRAAE